MASPERTAGEVGRLLRRLVDELLAHRAGGHLVSAARLEDLDIRLPLSLAGDTEAFAAELRARVAAEVDEAIRQAVAFRPGHVYCHRCRAAACAHSSPPSSRHVFTGYGATGLPAFEPLNAALLAARHEEVHRLYEGPPAVLTLVQDTATLHAGLLQAFESPANEIAAQLVAGFFRPPGAGRDGARVALTVQVTSSRSSRRGLRLGLNVLGDPAAAWPADLDPPWRSALEWAQEALRSVAGGRRGAAAAGARRGRESGRRRIPSPGQVEERAIGILNGLGRRLRRDQRGRHRRTGHAEKRHSSGARPTRKAVDDARSAPPESFLLDERRDTLVVLGERGRTHFFTPAGRLASSVRYTRDAVERKRKQGIWRPAPSARVAALRSALDRMSGEDEAGPA